MECLGLLVACLFHFLFLKPKTMKQLKSSLWLMAVLVLLAACSADEEKETYRPTAASSVNSTVYVEVQDGEKAVSPSAMLYECKFSVFGKASKRTLNVDAYKLDDVDVFRFFADLPDESVMKFWDTVEGKRGEGADRVSNSGDLSANLRWMVLGSFIWLILALAL